MKAKIWIIFGYIAIIGGKILPSLMAYQVMDGIRGPFSGGQMSQATNNLALVSVIGEFFFWTGIISAVFGFIKYFKGEE
jgi:hypothetical protein